MTTDPDAIITDARNYAVSVTAAATSALSAAMNVVNQIGQGYIGGAGPKLTLTPPEPGDPGEVPQYTGKHAEFEKFSGVKPSVNDPGSGNFPSAPGSAPGVSDFHDPVSARPYWVPDATLLGGVPTINTGITAPPAPTLSTAGITKPTLHDITIPGAPTYSPPEFVATRPTFDEAMPTDLDDLMHDSYVSMYPIMEQNAQTQLEAYIDRMFPEFRAGLAALEDRLQTYLDGGTALKPEIETAIYNRTLDKTDREGQKQIDDVMGRAARAGWTMPSPMITAQVNNVQRDRRDNNARAAIDIAIKQAELEQNNLQFAVTQSSNLRQITLNAAMAYFTGLVQINGQALEYARQIVDAVVRSFDIAARYAEVQTRIYEAEANVYRARLEGALASIQVYEAQIRAVQAQVQVDESQVNLYRAQLEGVMTEANLYKTQVEAVEAQISIEKMKVELYASKVGAFTAQVNGFSAQWQGYAAAVNGEKAKVEASAEQVRAYSAEVQAYQARVQAAATEIESKVRVNAQKLEAYRTDVEAYKALVDATATSVGTEITSFNSTIAAFTAKANAISEKSRAETANYSVAQQALIEAARLSYQYSVAHDNQVVARAAGTARIAEGIGQVYAGIAQSTLSGMNTLAASTTNTTV
jgi:hypothetical protein